jgi:hypothetical protein
VGACVRAARDPELPVCIILGRVERRVITPTVEIALAGRSALLQAWSVSRLVAAAVACVAFVLLTGSDGSLSARNLLVRESATILPEGTRILESDYHEQCLEFLRIPSPPCLSIRFRIPGSVDERAGTLLERADDRWNVTAESSTGNWSLRYRRGQGKTQLRAYADVLSTRYVRGCNSRALVRASCEDDLRVEVGPPAAPLEVELRDAYPPSREQMLQRLRQAHVLRSG